MSSRTIVSFFVPKTLFFSRKIQWKPCKLTIHSLSTSTLKLLHPLLIRLGAVVSDVAYDTAACHGCRSGKWRSHSEGKPLGTVQCLFCGWLRVTVGAEKIVIFGHGRCIVMSKVLHCIIGYAKYNPYVLLMLAKSGTSLTLLLHSGRSWRWNSMRGLLALTPNLKVQQ